MIPFDAVSNDALALQELLRTNGFVSDIFAEHIHTSLRNRVRTLDQLSDPAVDRLPMLYHVCAFAPRVVRVISRRAGPLYLRHHNITPAEWFVGISAGHEAACRGARDELQGLSRIARGGIADSAYNAQDLTDLGMRDVVVVPVLIAAAVDIAGSAETGGTYAITIGRIAPNKRIDLAIRTIVAYQRAFDPDFGLVIVGSDRGMERYAHACRDLATQLGARNITWAGAVEEHEKLRYLRGAAAYLCTSDHEGFCVPIVESFRVGLPVVARATSAVSGTCGRGLAVPTDDSSFVADVLHVVMTDSSLRARLVATQYQEAARFDPAVVGAQLLEWVGSVTAR